MPLNTSTFPAKSQRLLQQWGTSPSAQQDSHPPSAASELEERRVGSQVPPEQLCWAIHQPWPTREWPFGKKVQVVWEICHLKQHLGLAFLQGKLSAMTEGSLVFFFTACLVSAWHFKPQLLFQTLYRANSCDSDQKYLLIMWYPYVTQFMWKKPTPIPRYWQRWCDISQMF